MEEESRPSSPQAGLTQGSTSTPTTDRRKSGRVTRKPEMLSQSQGDATAGGAKRKRGTNGEEVEDADEDEEQDDASESEDDDEEPDEEEFREKKRAARKKSTTKASGTPKTKPKVGHRKSPR